MTLQKETLGFSNAVLHAALKIEIADKARLSAVP